MKPTLCDTFCRKAMYVARKSTMRQKHGCVIVYNNKDIVAEGYNHTRNNTMEKIWSTHAEIEAINKLRQFIHKKDKHFISKCKLYVVRIGISKREKALKQSSPCPHCSRAISSIGIQKVCYSDDDNGFEEEYIADVLCNMKL